MSPRVQANKYQKRRRAPRISSFFFQFDLVLKALTKMIFIFDQSFFITHLNSAVDLFRIVVFEKKTFQESFPQFHFCFPTSVL